jgi:hypothetical protein
MSSSSINLVHCGRSSVKSLHIEDLTEYVINKMVFSKNLKNEMFILVGDGTGDFQMEKIGVWDNLTKTYVLCVKLQYYGNANSTGYWIEDLLIDDKRTFIWTNITSLTVLPIMFEKNTNTNKKIYTNSKCTDVFTTINENDDADKTVFTEFYDMVLYKTDDDVLYSKTAKNKRIKIGFWKNNNFGGGDILFDDDEDKYERDDYCECDRYDVGLGY